MNIRRLTWPFACALVVLASRTLAYAVSPQPLLAFRLQHAVGGPRLVVLAVGVPLVATVVAASIVWLASVAVRERHLVAGGSKPSPMRIGRIVGCALVLFVCASLSFALLESYLHWRAGLGFHGLHCLIGPVHRDALPFLAALSLVAAAIVAAGRHLYAWMRRTLAELAARPITALLEPRRSAFARAVFEGRSVSAWNARGPPHAVRPC